MVFLVVSFLDTPDIFHRVRPLVEYEHPRFDPKGRPLLLLVLGRIMRCF